MIKVGERVPNVKIKQATAESPKDVITTDFFKGKTTVVFAVPGAFTPTCTYQHLPSYTQNLEALRAKGIDQVACLAVNDAFVLQAWAARQNAPKDLLLLADGSAELTKAMGLELDLSDLGMGVRSQRYVMVVKDGAVTHLDVEPVASACTVSGADSLLQKL